MYCKIKGFLENDELVRLVLKPHNVPSTRALNQQTHFTPPILPQKMFNCERGKEQNRARVHTLIRIYIVIKLITGQSRETKDLLTRGTLQFIEVLERLGSETEQLVLS